MVFASRTLSSASSLPRYSLSLPPPPHPTTQPNPPSRWTIGPTWASDARDPSTFPCLLSGTCQVVTSSEFEAVQNYPYMFDLGFQFLFLSSAVMAFFLNITTFYATALNSPLAVNVTGQMKNFFAFLLGLVRVICLCVLACGGRMCVCVSVAANVWIIVRAQDTSSA